MLLARPIRVSLLILLGSALATDHVAAQPVLVTLWTPEAKVARADHVAVGKIMNLSRRLIVAPGSRSKDGSIDPNGRSEYTIAVKVDELLKGDLKGGDLKGGDLKGGD